MEALKKASKDTCPRGFFRFAAGVTESIRTPAQVPGDTTGVDNTG